MTSPCYVYLIAFEIKFIKICLSLFPSVAILVGKSYNTIEFSLIPIYSAFKFKTEIHSLNTDLISKSSLIFKTNLLASN
jgi:hypothetical protein